MKNFTKTWNKSIQPRKQRKYRYNAPLNVKRNFLFVNLSKELRTKHKIRSLRVRKGDTVKIMRGDHKGKNSKVLRVSHNYLKVYLENLVFNKKDGSKKNISFEPSNLQITNLNLDDKKRLKVIDRKFKKTKKTDTKS